MIIKNRISDRGAAFKRVAPSEAAIAVGRSVRKVVPPKGLSVYGRACPGGAVNSRTTVIMRDGVLLR